MSIFSSFQLISTTLILTHMNLDLFRRIPNFDLNISTERRRVTMLTAMLVTTSPAKAGIRNSLFSRSLPKLASAGVEQSV